MKNNNDVQSTFSASNNISEFDELPKNHQNALSHPCLKFDNYWDYKDSLYQTYHFNKSKKDKPVEHSLRFINHGIDHDIKNFIRETETVGYTNDIELAQNTLWLAKMGVEKFNFSGYKQPVTKEKHPTLHRIVEWLEFEVINCATIVQQMPSQWEIWQTPDDKFCIKIHLQDWEFGQLQMLGTKMIIQWRAGDIIVKSQMPFCSGNSSRHIQYYLDIIGTPSQSTLAKIQRGGEIHV